MDILLEILDKAGLDEEHCKKSKKLYEMRTILIDKYVYLMSREEICYDLDDMSWRTYHRRLNEALLRIKKFI
jgi:uncharacterized secreted protein with C-terminal beta-propeller domain